MLSPFWSTVKNVVIKLPYVDRLFFILNQQRADIDQHKVEIEQLKAQVTGKVWQPQISDEDILLKQVMSILHKEHGIALPPPKHLQIRVAGDYNPYFIDKGFRYYEELNCGLKLSGKEIKDFKTVLDFGCGCGRVFRALKTFLPSSELYGADIDGEAIDWLENNYAKFGKFAVIPHLPPTLFRDDMFDLVIGLSVFTHLPEEMQFHWLQELNRITKPNGYLILTTHGEKFWRSRDAQIVKIMEHKGFYYFQPDGNYGKSVSLPDFYQVTYHSHNYIKEKWGKYFEVIDIQARGIDDHQDIVLLRKR
jgi:SAM-dependent methyltransferase